MENYFGSRADVETVLATLAAESLPVPFGINVLDDGPASFALADTYGAAFVQMDSVAGHLPADQDPGFAHPSRTFGRRVRRCSRRVRFKYQPVLSENPLDVDLHPASQRCDAVVVTGDKTGNRPRR